MKKLIVFCIAISSLMSCLKNEESLCDISPTPYYRHQAMHIYQINYENYKLEQFFFLSWTLYDSTNYDSIPLEVLYNPPNDNGVVTIIYALNDAELFTGLITKGGTGYITWPYSGVDSTNVFINHIDYPQPDSSTIQLIADSIWYNDSIKIDYTKLWNAVNNKSALHEAILDESKYGLYLYTPSVDPGKTEDWSYLLFVFNQDYYQ